MSEEKIWDQDLTAAGFYAPSPNGVSKPQFFRTSDERLWAFMRAARPDLTPEEIHRAEHAAWEARNFDPRGVWISREQATSLMWLFRKHLQPKKRCQVCGAATPKYWPTVRDRSTERYRYHCGVHHPDTAIVNQVEGFTRGPLERLPETSIDALMALIKRRTPLPSRGEFCTPCYGTFLLEAAQRRVEEWEQIKLGRRLLKETRSLLRDRNPSQRPSQSQRAESAQPTTSRA